MDFHDACTLNVADPLPILSDQLYVKYSCTARSGPGPLPLFPLSLTRVELARQRPAAVRDVLVPLPRLRAAVPHPPHEVLHLAALALAPAVHTLDYELPVLDARGAEPVALLFSA